LHETIAPLFEEDKAQAGVRQMNLTKPPGALGRLEEIAITLAGLQGYECPQLDQIFITVFAGDHGVASHEVSAFPQSVTAEMVRNFSRGGAAINVLARELGALLEVVNLGTVVDTGSLENVLYIPLGAGTADFCTKAAMTSEQLTKALHAGRDAARRAGKADSDLFIGGEMGIGNTTSASALACALLDQPPSTLAGPGTGLDTRGVVHKVEVLQKALQQHQQAIGQPLEILRCLGGFEITALVGAYIACGQAGLPVLVDGFISSVAALMATKLSPKTRNWLLFSHQSAEPGHRLVLEAMDARPLISLGMRLGEGSGAAVTVPLLRAACVLHKEMAPFAQAGISEKKA
jgi:nicotinate-nucleotide--dimethylbenzimidazole phosphoribosyltransferase